ncbi:MAG TPA: hypothetical protein VKU01_18980 [Bryobacteraceae bacterium]|nr:hypothetical protein [Bryobacteraceae bacterium]
MTQTTQIVPSAGMQHHPFGANDQRRIRSCGKPVLQHFRTSDPYDRRGSFLAAVEASYYAAGGCDLVVRSLKALAKSPALKPDEIRRFEQLARETCAATNSHLPDVLSAAEVAQAGRLERRRRKRARGRAGLVRTTKRMSGDARKWAIPNVPALQSVVGSDAFQDWLKSNQVVRHQPRCTETELLQVETLLGHLFPEPVRECLLIVGCPEGFLGAVEIFLADASTHGRYRAG